MVFGSQDVEIIAILILKLHSCLVKLNHQEMEFKVLIAQKKNLNSVILSITFYYFEILSMHGAEIVQQGSITLLPISDSHQCAVQTACMWKFSPFFLVLYHILHVMLLYAWTGSAQYIMHYLDWNCHYGYVATEISQWKWTRPLLVTRFFIHSCEYLFQFL